MVFLLLLHFPGNLSGQSLLLLQHIFTHGFAILPPLTDQGNGTWPSEGGPTVQHSRTRVPCLKAPRRTWGRHTLQLAHGRSPAIGIPRVFFA